MGGTRARLEATDTTARPPAAGAPAHPVLALQRQAGNRAVRALLRREATPERDDFLFPDPPPPHRPALDERMRAHFGVQTIRAGTQQDQIEELTRAGNSGITSLPGWEAWEPGPWHPMYEDLEAAFEDMARVLGGTPVVREIRFFKQDYVVRNGTVVPRPNALADFGDGILRIYAAWQSRDYRLATGADTPQGPAALDHPDIHTSRRRVIVHELSHGVAERFGTPGLEGAEEGFFAHWAAAGSGAGEQYISDYARTNPGEDFADSLMAYVEAGDVLRARSPGRARFFDDRRETFARHLRHRTP